MLIVIILITLKKKYITLFCEPNEQLIYKIKKFKPNIIFNALHGRFGEDGYIQTILEDQKVKYTHSGSLASYTAMNKVISKEIFKKNKILTPKYFKFEFSNKNSKKKIINKIKSKLKFPVVIKPINEGSSVDVYICSEKNIIKNLKKLEKYEEVLIEKYIVLVGWYVF